MANAMAAVAGRSARACDVCALKRSRWYCAADEAYLCEGCDSSVHAANALASRHERVRLTSHGVPVKSDRRGSINHGSSKGKKKQKVLSSTPPFKNSNSLPTLHQQHHAHANFLTGHPDSSQGLLRKVKVESTHQQGGNCAPNDLDTSADDHFTAEELTGNANLLDDPSMCPPSQYGDGSSDPSFGNHGLLHEESDFAHDFLVSDPNDPHNTNTSNCGDFVTNTNSSGAPGGELYHDDEDDECDGDEGDDSMGTGWMDLANRELCGDGDEYCVDPSILRESVAATGAHDQSVALYSHDEKPERQGECGSSQSGAFKNNMAGRSEWVKLEGGYSNDYSNSSDVSLQSLADCNSACKIEGLSMSGSDARLVPSLRLNYADVLSSWPDRGMRWMDDGSGPQLVPDNSNSDGMGSCYDLGLVPDLSSTSGVDCAQFPPMYGGPRGGGAGAGDDANAACNAREARVSRYREKRRTRLFSKKIRYEVRKLNAERRPRMKGRFVKRSPGTEAS